jgi:MATE family multidrug resistance protein
LNTFDHAELRTLLRISTPLAAAYLAEIAMAFTDMVIVGRLGSIELAAVGLAASVFFELLLVAVGVVSIVAVLAAEAFGAGNETGVSRATRQGLWVALVLSIPGTLIGWYLAPILALTGQDTRVIALADQYLHAVAWSFLPYLCFMVLRNFVSALSRTGSVMVIAVVAIGVNLFFTYGLVFGRLGLPKLGVAGAGWATTITVWLMLAAIVVYTAFSKHFQTYRLYRTSFRIELPMCAQIFRLGLPVAGITALEGGLFAALSIFMGVLGALWLAANAIVINVLAVGFVIALAVGEAIGIRIAQGVGANDRLAVRRSTVTGLALGLLVMAFIASLMWTFPTTLVSIFLDIDDPQTVDVLPLAVVLAGIAAVVHVFDGLQAVATRALRGLKDTIVPLWVAAVGYWLLGVLGGWVLCFPLKFGALGLWWGLVLGLTVTGVVLLWRLMLRTRVLA